MSYSIANALKGTEVTYDFDPRLVRKTLRTFRPKHLAVWICLGVLSFGWLNLEDFLHQKRTTAFELEHAAVQKQINHRIQETDLVLAIISSFDTGLPTRKEKELATLILDLADYYRMDPFLILGVIRVESYFYNRAVSNAGAEGLMQVLPLVGEEVAEELGIPYRDGKTLFNPIMNVQIGTFYLSQLIKGFNGDVEMALLAYNRGPNGLKRALYRGDGIPTDYADSVLSQYQLYLEQHKSRQNLALSEI